MRPLRSTSERSALRAGALPRWRPVTGGFGLGLTFGCQVEHPAAFGLVGRDETLVLEGLEGGVDGAGAGPPHPAAAFGELGDDLVAVHGLLGQQGDDGGPDVAPAGSRPPAEGGIAEPRTEAPMTAEPAGAAPTPTAAPAASPSQVPEAVEPVPVGEGETGGLLLGE